MLTGLPLDLSVVLWRAWDASVLIQLFLWCVWQPGLLSGWGDYFFVVPGLLYFAKALCDVLMLITGYWLYKDVIGPEGSLML